MVSGIEALVGTIAPEAGQQETVEADLDAAATRYHGWKSDPGRYVGSSSRDIGSSAVVLLT